MKNLNDLKSYLSERKIDDKKYLDFVLNNRQTECTFKLCSVNKFDFMVTHFLDATNRIEFGLMKTNSILNLDETEWLAIALIDGGDVICMNTKSEKIYLWLIQSGDASFLKVANSFSEFLEKCVDC